MSLFTTKPAAPLAELMRPKVLDDVVGQAHLLGPGKPLRMAFEAKKLHSFILWGPPGVGKTTLGRLAASVTGAHFLSLSAVLAGVKDIRTAVDAAQTMLDEQGRPTVLFVDEIHRFNKSQQDALLPDVESGLLTLVGGTTEHPGLEVVGALLSRAQVYSLLPLSSDELQELYRRAQPHLHGTSFEPAALELLKGFSDGDGRRFLNLVEQVAAAAVGAEKTVVSEEFAKEATSPSLRRFDKGGDQLYWLLSAFHKSLRGSQPDAALYWMARIIDGGGDARHVARRMVAMASEDIGNADPRALQVAVAAAQAYDRLGAPEGGLALAQAATYLAVAAKSNASYAAWNQAKAFVRQTGSLAVPLHLRNAPVQLMKDMGYKEGYRYAHSEPNAYAAGQTYFPDGVPNPGWYQPTDRGLEAKIREKLTWLNALDAASAQAAPASAPSRVEKVRPADVERPKERARPMDRL